MITVVRGPEPQALTTARSKHLERAIEAFNAHGSGSAQLHACLDGGYAVAKPTLFKRQHKKCAYCEQKVPFDEQPTEHFRPKKYALRTWRQGEAKDKDVDRYWWLSPLPPDHFDLSTEQALLVDPADSRTDPLDHMRWRPLEPWMPPALWTWGVRGVTARGRATVAILKLDDRAEFINAIYKQTIWPRFLAEVLGKANTPKAAIAAWTKLSRDLIQPDAEFAAARWCMLEALRTSSHAIKLQLPEPSRPGSPTR